MVSHRDTPTTQKIPRVVELGARTWGQTPVIFLPWSQKDIRVIYSWELVGVGSGTLLWLGSRFS